MKLLFNNGDQHVSGDGVSDLRFVRALAVVDETFDTQCCLIHLQNHSTCQRLWYSATIVSSSMAMLLVRNTYVFPTYWSLKRDASQLLGIVLKDVDTVEHDVLIADDDSTPINFHLVHSMCVYSSFGASYEERTRLMQRDR